jgi:phenylpyruvate tautomerase PptA (4-oxalocrotonate tautomerase family)
MPLLTITTTADPDRENREAFLEDFADLYADVMDSETSFVSIRIQPVPAEDLWLGRAEPGAPIVLLEADIREGRSVSKRREFALEAMERFHAAWEMPYPNMKVVFTEHDGAHMMGYDRVGSDW